MNPHGEEWNLLLPENHEDHIAGKGFTSMSHFNLVRKFIPMPEAMEIMDAKIAVDEEWRDYQIVSDKHLMQYLPILRKNWRMLPDCSKFLNQNVQTFGYVFHDKKWLNSWGNIEDPVVPL